MASAPLATKLHPPPPCPTLVTRPRLYRLLDNALSRPVTLVSAPPGYGKTTLIASWLRTLSLPWTWLSLEEADDDPVRFLQYLLSSLQVVAPAIHPDLMGPLQGSEPLPDKGLIDLLVNGISGAPPFVLVLDDLHCILDAAVYDRLGYLLDHLPAPMHIVILTRIDPPLQLSRLRVRDQLVEIRGEHLRFTPEETGEFLTGKMGLGLTSADAAAMAARTEGWIAGLHLAALSMRGVEDSHGFVAALAGTHHYIMDYLVEQVLAKQPEETRDFLLQTSILASMCGELCSCVAEKRGAGAVDGQAMLETLERMNLFVVPLDEERRWYRYHRLFADVLNRSLERRFPDRVAVLHSRASAWHEGSGLIREAIHHALQAGERERAVQLIEQNGCGFLLRGEVVSLLKRIEAVEPFLETHPWLGVLKAWGLTLTGRPDQAEQALQAAERLMTQPVTTYEGQTVMGSISAARARCATLAGDVRLAAAHAQQALKTLPDASLFSCSMRGVATTILGDARSSVGDLEAARAAYADAARMSDLSQNAPLSVLAKSNAAHILLEQGQLHESQRVFEEALQLATRPDGSEWPRAEEIHVGLAIGCYEWNLLDRAEEHLRACLNLCKRWGPSQMQPISQALLARIHAARGNADAALEAAEAAGGWADESQFSPEWLSWLRSTLARFWIGQRRPGRAAAYLQACQVDRDGTVPPVRLPEFVSLARVLLARGDVQGALDHLDRLLGLADGSGRIRRLVEILLLQASAFWEHNETTRSLASLTRALSLAERDGYVRSFLDEGPVMTKLLQEARTRGPGSEYAAVLLSATRKGASRAAGYAAALVEPLTPRELEVLQFIHTGCSNQEIASRLVISPATLKRHITNLYAKLGVGSRTQALSAARELQLID